MAKKQYTISEVKQILTGAGKISQALLEEFRSDKRKGVQELLKRHDKQEQEKMRLAQAYDRLLTFEKQCRTEGFQFIAGVDEAGRGPLAGPVTAAAAILPENITFPGLTDSKKLNLNQRNYFEKIIKEKAAAFHIVHIPADVIDEINIYKASQKAMLEAIKGLSVDADALLVDAMTLPLSAKQISLIKGDARSASIAAASVLAKTARDRYMNELAEKHPQYGFATNMGYGTKNHLEALRIHGPIKEHRRSFSPVQACL
ncbi:ribonuclease HII [Alteribacillus sp. HJP-4]|uniref:ribonuclease HII n=1 Tax=Alteribacillus sp. HJP-4 TaxID=2775394 RepID=UPI0035CD3BFF